MKNRTLGIIILLLFASQVLVILVSWLINAVVPDSSVRSLLSSEGIRWFFGNFTSNLQTPILIWGLLLSIAYSSLQKSRLLNYRKQKSSMANQRMAMRMTWIVFFILVGIMILLTSVPHAILLSVTGNLFPSSFSQSMIPVVCFICVACSMTYGYLSGSLKSIADFYDALTAYIPPIAKLLPVYVLACQLIHSIMFILKNS